VFEHLERADRIEFSGVSNGELLDGHLSDVTPAISRHARGARIRL
jgi:hypothetical protein